MNNRELRILAELNKIGDNVDHFSYEQLKYAVGSLIPNIPISLKDYQQIWRPKEDWMRDFYMLHRARINQIRAEGFTGLYPWEHERDISHVPLNESHLIKDYGRCNRPGDVVFYCSNYAPTSCCEVLSKGFTKEILMNHVTIGHWRIKSPLTLAQINFSLSKLRELKELTKFPYDNLIKMADGWKDHALKKFGSKGSYFDYSPEFSIAVLEFFSDHFGNTNIKTEHDYYISSLYTDIIFNHSHTDENGGLFDGLIYPSVKNSLQEFNIVLHPRAMNKLKFTGATYAWMTSSLNQNPPSVEYTPWETAGATDSGKLIWNQFKIPPKKVL
jgi:hypothetical protein